MGAEKKLPSMGLSGKEKKKEVFSIFSILIEAFLF
jgi:hypothetical protein